MLLQNQFGFNFIAVCNEHGSLNCVKSIWYVVLYFTLHWSGDNDRNPKETKQSSPHSIKSIIRAIHCQHRRSCISFCYTTISLKDNYFCPNLVVYLCPFAKYLLYVILKLYKNWRKKLIKNFAINLTSIFFHSWLTRPFLGYNRKLRML